MKLWQKISLISIALVMISINVTAVTVTSSYFSSSIKREKQQNVSSHEYYAASISNTLAYERIRSDQIILSKKDVADLLNDKLSSPASDLGIAVYNGSTAICSAQARVVSESPEFIAAVQKSEKILTLIKDYSGKTYLAVGSQIRLEGEDYSLFTVKDISEIYTVYRQQLKFITAVSIAFAALASLVLIAAVFGLLSRLTKINLSIKQIAAGDYGIQIDEKGGAEFKELAGNVNVMTRAIGSNVNKLQTIADNRKQFIDSMAHEMKTPLTSIMCLADIMRIKRYLSDEERQEYAGIIVEEAGRLAGLSEKLLTLSVSDSRQLELKPTSVSCLLDEVYAAYAPVVRKRGIRLVVSESDAFIAADAELFKSMLFNLLDNAQKASEDGQEIHINCRTDGDSVVISVTDHGVGMDETQLSRAAEPFYMADKTRSRKFGGAGLGLSLCSSIAQLHNAEMSIKSRPGIGTTVSLKIPVSHGGFNNEKN